MQLSDQLSEISDLALADDGESLWAVHDEKGALFRISTKDGSIVETFDFHKKGDFEGVALIDGRILVGRSDGELFWVDAKTHESTKFSSDLGPTCDLEGLAWDAANARVLMSCKQPQGKKDDRSWRVWSLDPKTQKVATEPVFTIDRSALEKWVSGHPGLSEVDIAHADPSGIAIDPNGNVVLISTRGRMKLTLSSKGEVQNIEALDREQYRQPEGIAFGKDGTLFISNEARGAHATLCKIAQPHQ